MRTAPAKERTTRSTQAGHKEIFPESPLGAGPRVPRWPAGSPAASSASRRSRTRWRYRQLCRRRHSRPPSVFRQAWPARQRPPPLGCLLTRRTAIPRLRTARLKELLAPLQQTAPPPRPPARGLPSTRSSIMLKKTQGSVNSRRSSLGEEPLSSPRHLIPTALSLGLPPLQANPSSPAVTRKSFFQRFFRAKLGRWSSTACLG